MKSYWVYIMASKSGTLYVGVTNDLEKRVYEHKNKLVEGFSAKYNVHRLVYFEEFKWVEQAIEMEKKIKGWSRLKKINLIKSINPEMKDIVFSS